MAFFEKIAMRSDLHRVFEKLFAAYMPRDATVYDIGCGQKPFASFLKGKVKSHIGVDLADGFYKPDQVDLIGTAYAVPAPDGCADVVISSQVIEHLETPLVAINETHRLLKAEGVFFLSFPFLYPQHAQPRDFLRYTEFYLKQEIAADKFEVITFERIGGFWYLMGMYLNLYLQQLDRGVLKKVCIIKILIFIFSLFFRGLHALEETLFNIADKDVKEFRARWTVNYVAVLKKRGAGSQ
jgi:SAM-dependent methyltransferase